MKALTLGLGLQWRVVECRFEAEPKRWRHLNFFQYRCEQVAKVPRPWCRTDGVHLVQVPRALEGSGFTLIMKAIKRGRLRDLLKSADVGDGPWTPDLILCKNVDIPG